jgi:hypothetical protein
VKKLSNYFVIPREVICYKKVAKLLLPPFIVKIYRWLLYAFINKKVAEGENENENERRRLFSEKRLNVDNFLKEFCLIPDDLLYDETFIEKFIIEKIGLNNEVLHEQPPELKPYYGTGLYIWQNPKQFSKYIVWLMRNGKNYSSYLEIGCRWGGTFIVICEVLHRINPDFKLAIAVDLVEKTPFIERYIEIANGNGFEIIYFKGPSTSEEFHRLIEKKQPEISFIDGDHRLEGGLKDHMLVREKSKIIVHHDISSDSCPDTTFLWDCLKKLEINRKSIEFTEQYSSVKNKYLGIGVLY